MKELSVDRLDCFAEIVHVMKTSPQYERVFHLIVYRVAQLFQCQTVAIVLINPKTEYLTIANSYGLSQTFCNEFRKKLATGAIGEMLWTGKPILVTDSAQQPKLTTEVQLEHPFGSCACLQIAVDHRTVGYLFADSIEKHAFGDADVVLLQTFADIAGIAYYKSQLADENMKLDRIDRETGTEKYSTFLEKLRQVADRAQTSREQFSIVLLDVDNFKTITSTYGHDASSQLLRQLADLIRSSRQPAPTVGRYGFDEFIVLLEKTGLSDTVAYAAKLLKDVQDTSFTANCLKTTISLGVSSCPQNATTVDELIVTAKNALFEAQRAGKNRVFHYLKRWYEKDAT